MKPKYTVRLTEELDGDERLRIAERVAGVTDIEADKIERLLERGRGKDLIKPSGANVANRLASVLAEAGAPVQLVPVTEPEPVPEDAVEPAEVAPEEAPPTARAPAATELEAGAEDEEVLRPRTEAPPSRPVAEEPVEAEMPEPEQVEPERIEPELPGPGARETELPQPRAAEPEPPEPETEAPERVTGATAAPAEPSPEETAPAPAEPEVARPRPEPRPGPRRSITEPPPPAPANRGAGVLGAIGAALLGIGAFLSLGFLENPIGIGILVLALLALGLSFVGQRRAMWLPGLGALALVVWALANAEAGVMATLAANWQWFAMFAGSLLVIVAGAQAAQRGHGP